MGKPREFFEQVVVSFAGEECLLWPFAKNTAGYGKLGIGRKFPHVHRLACERVHGAPPSPDHEAAHSCGKGHEGCVNPRHLRWATPSENQMDRVDHGTDGRGTRNPRTKLQPAQVIEIHRLKGKLTQPQIAKRFGVSRGCVDGIHRGEKWGWLTGEQAAA